MPINSVPSPALSMGMPKSAAPANAEVRLRRSAFRVQPFVSWLLAHDDVGNAVVGRANLSLALILLSLRAAGRLLALLVQPLHFLLALLKCSRHRISLGYKRYAYQRKPHGSYQRGSRGWRVASR